LRLIFAPLFFLFAISMIVSPDKNNHYIGRTGDSPVRPFNANTTI
jgi:hypothetical protein